jgi:hypothetical protein
MLVRVQRWQPIIAFSSTSSRATARAVWKTVPRPASARRCAVQSVTSSPPTRTRPVSTRMKPETQLSRVDFPAPFGPIRQVSEPRETRALTPSTAATAPNDFRTPSTSQAYVSASTATGLSSRQGSPDVF